MNEKTFQFLRDEILECQSTGAINRLKQFRAIEGYLLAAKRWRESYNRRTGSGEYADLPRDAAQFDTDCSRVST